MEGGLAGDRTGKREERGGRGARVSSAEVACPYLF